MATNWGPWLKRRKAAWSTQNRMAMADGGVIVPAKKKRAPKPLMNTTSWMENDKTLVVQLGIEVRPYHYMKSSPGYFAKAREMTRDGVIAAAQAHLRLPWNRYTGKVEGLRQAIESLGFVRFAPPSSKLGDSDTRCVPFEPYIDGAHDAWEGFVIGKNGRAVWMGHRKDGDIHGGAPPRVYNWIVHERHGLQAVVYLR